MPDYPARSNNEDYDREYDMRRRGALMIKDDPNRKEAPRPSASLVDALLTGGKDTFTSYETIAPGGLEWLWDKVGGRGSFRDDVPSEEKKHEETMRIIRDWDEYADNRGFKRPQIPQQVIDYYKRTGRLPTGGRSKEELGQTGQRLYGEDLETVAPGHKVLAQGGAWSEQQGRYLKPTRAGQEAINYLLNYQREQPKGRVPTIFTPRD